MASTLKNLSKYDHSKIPDASDMKFGIVVSEWNIEITGSLLEGAIKTLKLHGAREENIEIRWVPGSFELTLGGQFFAEYRDVDAVLCLGCVIQGETRHFDFICQGVSYGITDLNLNNNIPFIFGVLTTENQQRLLTVPAVNTETREMKLLLQQLKWRHCKGRWSNPFPPSR